MAVSNFSEKPDPRTPRGAAGRRESGLARVPGGELTRRTDDAMRLAYLNAKGINPHGPHQLDLLFPLNDSQRFIPNDFARTALFTTRNKRVPRRQYLNEVVYHLHTSVVVKYSGTELRAEDDEIIWLQILHYAKNVPLGSSFEVSIKDLVRDVGWSKNGTYYDKARQCISRLKANEILFENKKAYGRSPGLSLIGKYEMINDGEGQPTRYRMLIDPELILLFAGNNFSNHGWDRYLGLKPVARRLADYIESHKHPFPLSLESFKHVCGSEDASTTSWRQTVRKACKQIEDCRIAAVAFLDSDDKIYFA